MPSEIEGDEESFSAEKNEMRRKDLEGLRLPDCAVRLNFFIDWSFGRWLDHLGQGFSFCFVSFGNEKRSSDLAEKNEMWRKDLEGLRWLDCAVRSSFFNDWSLRRWLDRLIHVFSVSFRFFRQSKRSSDLAEKNEMRRKDLGATALDLQIADLLQVS